MSDRHMQNDIYIINTVTNLHVGSGDNNFGIIDNQVQRDVTTHLPTIYASSLKGALREHFDPLEDETQFVKYVFGSHPKKDKGNDSQKGAFGFLSANLLVLPLRSNTKVFFRATSSAVIKELLENLTIFDIEIKQKNLLQELADFQVKSDEFVIFENLENTIIEDELEKAKIVQKDLTILEKILGKDIVLLHDNDFKKYCDNLPVVARNHLDDGVSQNLWYEEVVPRESRFYFITTKPTNLDKSDKDRIERFEKQFSKDKLVQIGANATVGYGYTSISRINS